jgi:large subunit ribosomal protein L9
MKVILNDHIDHLGERGDVVTVKPGYARNFLLPKGLAYLDSPGNRRQFDQEQQKWEEMDLERRSAAEKMAANMTGTELLFERRAGEKDVLFGSVNLADIAKALADRGFEIDRRRVLLDHPIKELGTFTVDVRVHRDFEVAIPVHVVRPGEQPGSADEEPESTDPSAVSDAEEAPGGAPVAETSEPTALETPEES